MLTFKRALVFAAFALTVLFFLSGSHRRRSDPPSAPAPDPDSYISALSNELNGGGIAGAAPESSKTTPPRPALDQARARRLGPASGPRPVADMSGMSLYERLEYQYPYDPAVRFPAYIWQTWKNTPASAEFRFREQESSWSVQHPGFVHEVITDAVALSLLRLLYAAVPEVLEAYEAMPMPVLRADFFRYLILLARGGVYSDIDTYAIRSAIEWVPEPVPAESVGLVIGIEADPDRPDWHDWYSRRIQFCQWTIQAKPGHPVLRDVVARITRATLVKKRSGLLGALRDRDVIEFTGPAVWTDTILDHFNNGRYFDLSRSPGEIDWRNFTGMEAPKKVGDVLVLPITSFSPGVQQMGAKDLDDPMAFVKHDFEGSWKPEELRHIGDSDQ